MLAQGNQERAFIPRWHGRVFHPQKLPPLAAVREERAQTLLKRRSHTKSTLLQVRKIFAYLATKLQGEPEATK